MIRSVFTAEKAAGQKQNRPGTRAVTVSCFWLGHENYGRGSWIRKKMIAASQANDRSAGRRSKELYVGNFASLSTGMSSCSLSDFSYKSSTRSLSTVSCSSVLLA